MDPLTHALTGAAAGWISSGRKLGRVALLAGTAAGLLPDIDVLIRSDADPLLAIEHHRGFTHSLLFSPLGAAIAAVPFLLKDRARASAYLAATLAAYLSHLALDSATTYGTQLFWPFSKYRVGLDIISIIDPLFTLIVLAGVVAAFASRKKGVVAALAVAVAWLAIGAFQRERAMHAQSSLASSRGDVVARGEVFPTIGNTIVWRSVYETRGVIRMDRIRVPWLGANSYAPTTSVALAVMPRFDVAPALDERLRRDFERFAWFSGGWIARDPSDAEVIGDARYSLSASEWKPVWGIRFRPAATPPTEWVNRTRDRAGRPSELWDELSGRSLEFVPLE